MGVLKKDIQGAGLSEENARNMFYVECLMLECMMLDQMYF